MANAITPQEAIKSKVRSIPEEVLEAFNELIVENLSSGRSTVMQDDVISRIREKMHWDVTRQQIFDKGWLDVEDVFREAGWLVEYDKPGYCEDYSASFKFMVR